MTSVTARKAPSAIRLLESSAEKKRKMKGSRMVTSSLASTDPVIPAHAGIQYDDLGDHRTGPAFEQFGEYAQAKRGPYGASELPDATEHDDHEGIDDVA